MGREKRSHAISIFFFAFLLGYPAGVSAKKRGVVWFGSWALIGPLLGPRWAPIVTNIVWVLGSSKYTDTDICQIPF